MEQPPTTSRTFLRLLLRLLPRAFREEYGPEMEALVLARLHRAGSRRVRARIWSRVVRDMVVNGVALRRKGWRGDRVTNRMGGWGGMMDGIMQDLRYAARTLARNPLFSLGAVALLAVGIGLNAAAFSVVDSFLLRPPPWEEPERVVHVYQDSDDGEPSSSSFPAARDMAGSPVFSSVAATTPSRAVWDSPEGPVEIATEYTTSHFMEVAGLQPLRGRWFDAEHDTPGTGAVAVVTAGAWRRLFGADPDMVGRALTLNGVPVTVIGVGPEGLEGSFGPLVTDLWLSISATHVSGPVQVANLDRRQDHWYDVRARLAEGVSVEQAQAAMDALAVRLGEQFPDLNRARGITVFPSADVRLHPGQDGQLRVAGGLLLGVVLTVLLLACANLANLLLIRGLARSGEMAVRTALGAGRRRVVRLFFSEAFLLTAAGGVAGILLAVWTLSALGRLSLDLPGSLGPLPVFHVDGRVMVFLFALMALTTSIFGLVPALRAGGPGVASILREDSGSVSQGRRSLHLGNVLVVVQIAGSLVLILGTGLLARSLVQLQGVDRGVDVDRVAFVEVDWSRAGLEGPAAMALLDDVLQRVGALPGVTAAAATSRLPAAQWGSTTTEVEGYTPVSGTGAVEFPFAMVTEGYFQVMGARIVEGRGFEVRDRQGEGTSILINEAAARRFYGDESALGRRMRGQGEEAWTRTVVGVVSDIPVNGLTEEEQPMFYFSARQTGYQPAIVVARTDGDAGALVTALRATLRDPSVALPLQAEGTLAAHFGAALRGPRLAASAMGLFSILALILSGLGIYAVVSYGVSRRTTELGIRLALGADRGDLVRMVVREVLGVVALGLAAGLGLALLVAPGLSRALYRVPAFDPASLAGAVALLLGVAVLAAWLPARRATRQDPAQTLRIS